MSNPFETHGIDHLSASHVNLFVAQPALWAVSYLLKKRTPVGPAAHRGTAIEAGVEAGLFDPEMPVAECIGIAESKYHSLTRLNADPRVEKERSTIADSVRIALAELRQYGIPDKPADGEGRQNKIIVQHPDLPIPFIGYIDFRWSQHGIIGDLKSTARMPSEMSDAHARQGALYTHSGSNMQTRMVYVTPKKICAMLVEDTDKHYADLIKAAKAIERFLSLSDDGEFLTHCFYPDMGSFYWGDASAKHIAQEVWS
jgi:hypothetical protein